MEDHDKLPVLIEHWIEHNDSHREEFDRWALRAADAGLADAAAAIRAAAGHLQTASEDLGKALAALKGQNG